MKTDLERFDLQMPEYHYPASLVRLAVEKAELEKRAQTHLRAVGVIDVPDDELFMFGAVISSSRLDSYYTRMADSSLMNYAQDAKTGVSFLIGHQHNSLAIGYSIGGQFERSGTPPEGFPRVVADFYTVKAVAPDFINRVQYGLVRDVSIGFKEGEGFQYTCSICGRDLFDWDCDHIPGGEYETVSNPEADPSEQIREKVTAFAWVENARLSEVSAVFDGSNEDAMLVKATRELRAGRMSLETKRYFESAYRLKLPEQKSYPVSNPKKEREQNMKDKENEMSDMSDKNTVLVRSVALALSLTGITTTSSGEDCVRAMETEINRLRPFEGQATEGRLLRKQLVEETIAQGVRAYGKDFDKEAKEKMLKSLPVEVVGELRSTWSSLGDKNFAGKTRVSEDNPNPNKDGDDEQEVSATTEEEEFSDDFAGGV